MKHRGSVEKKNNHLPAGSLEPLDMINVQIPYHFRCPISLELMRDPVTVSTGQTYDRSSIESWVATGNTTCPVTRAPLTDFSLIPNHTLRRLIQDWCVSNSSFGVERIPTPKQPADPVTVRSLLSQASSGSARYQARVTALKRIRALARDSDKNRSVMLASAHNIREILLSVMFSSSSSSSIVDNSDSSELSHESLAILSMFPLDESEIDFVVSDQNRVSYIVSLLFHSSVEVRVNAASLIEIMISGTRSQEIRLQISSSDSIFEGIIGILNCPFSYPRALKVGIKALFALCLLKQHRHKAVEGGAVEALIDRMAEFEERCDAERALATVELLCRTPSGCAAFAGHAMTVPMLVGVILKVSDRATEYAAGVLVAVCSYSEEAKREAVAAGIWSQLVVLVQSECTERAKRKAQVLLKLLRDSWPQEYYSVVANSDDFASSDVVPF